VLDHDLKRFEDGIKQTPDGLKFLLAMHEARIAISEIDRLRRERVRRGLALRSWQLAYIKACDRATEAIDRLWDAYQWPSDAARARGFAWRPGENLRR
jgi:hypothetical protein